MSEQKAFPNLRPTLAETEPQTLSDVYNRAFAIARGFPAERHAAALEAMAQRSSASTLTFRAFSETSLSRALRWHSGGLEEWAISEWTNALAGEAGETCNAAKKLRRIECGMRQHGGDSGAPADLDEARRKIAKELGDTVAYADLTAQRIGWRLEDCVRLAFNQVSEREGFPERI